MKNMLVKISTAVILASLVLALFGIPAMADPAAMASTNDINRANGWAHVDQTVVGVGSTTLAFIQPRGFFACFEYRTDGDTSQVTNPVHPYNPAITDGLYPFLCLSTAGATTSRTFAASGYVEVRMTFGAEADERFDWTRFDVLPTPSIVASADDALFCVGETAVVTIDLNDVVDIYGYQFQVSYDANVVSADGAFMYDDPAASVPPLWDAVCASGICSFAQSQVSPALPQSGSGPVATITLIGSAPGAFTMAITNDVLSDIDGIAMVHTVSAPLPITVCGLATVSGFITMQGRPGNNVSAGTVSMTEQAPTNFSPVAPVPFDATTGAYSIIVPYMPAGSSYKIVAEHDLYLDNDDTISVTANLANKNTRLWGGDADNNAKVEITDLSCIGGAFGVFPIISDCGGQGSPDINEDSIVNIQDLSLAGGNYDKCGAQPWAWQTASPSLCP